MNEPTETVQTGLPTPVEDSGSLAEHVEQYGGPNTAPKADEGDEEPATGRNPRGQFQPRHRAESQKAKPDDIETINALTKRYRDVEAEIAADIKQQPGESKRVFEMRKRAEIAEALREAKKTPAAAVPVSRPVPPPAPRPMPAPPSTPAAAPKPNANDESKYPGGVYDPAYMEDLADWKAGERLSKWQQERADAEAKVAADAKRDATARSWQDRVTAAKAKYPDFEAKAIQAPTDIQSGSLIDAFIWESKSGADVLYHLQTHPNELQQIDALAPFEQIEALTLLGQRLTQPTQTAVSTGSATASSTAPTKVYTPPNPVRTGPMKSSDDPPDDDSSLAAHRKFYGTGRRR